MDSGDSVAQVAQKIITNFNQRHHHSYDVKFIRELKLLGLSDVQIAGTIMVLETTCLGCMDNSRHCKCQNDE